MNNIVIFASGKGSNAENIINYFNKPKNNYLDVKVVSIITNNQNAGVISVAAKNNIDLVLINDNILESDDFKNYLKGLNLKLIVLAGFLRKIPKKLIDEFKIINIHPSLLPKYGGKGMHGDNIHKAVIDAKEKESGITIHYVNENYDEGKKISSFTCKIKDTDTIENLKHKIRQLECLYYPPVVETVIHSLLKKD